LEEEVSVLKVKLDTTGTGNEEARKRFDSEITNLKQKNSSEIDNV